MSTVEGEPRAVMIPIVRTLFLLASLFSMIAFIRFGFLCIVIAG